MILSGFAIAAMLERRWPTYFAFLLGRALRLYPAYVVALLLGLTVAPLTLTVFAGVSWHETMYFKWFAQTSAQERAYPATHFLVHLTLLHGLLPHEVLLESCSTLLPPAWTQTIEWRFYLVAPMVVWLARAGSGIAVLAAAVWYGIDPTPGRECHNSHPGVLSELLSGFSSSALAVTASTPKRSGSRTAAPRRSPRPEPRCSPSQCWRRGGRNR